jgi:hypothetical protein
VADAKLSGDCMTVVCQIGVPSARPAAGAGRAAVEEGTSPWVIAGGIALMILMLAAWWYAKHS